MPSTMARLRAMAATAAADELDLGVAPGDGEDVGGGDAGGLDDDDS